MKKLMMTVIAAVVVAFAAVSKAAWNDDLPESFDSYVKQTSDGPIVAGNLASPFTDGEYWSSNEPPDGDHDYFVPAAREFNTPFWSGPTVKDWRFNGKSLVVEGKFRQLEGAGKANITIPELYWLGGSDMYYTGAKSAMMGNLHIRRSSAENPANFKISYSGIDLQKSKMKLDGDTNQVIKVFLGDSYVVKNTINGESFQGDLSAYYGTFEVHTNQHFQINGSMPGKVVMVDGNVWLENCGDAALAVGAVDARAASCIVTSAGKNMSVGDLSLSADAVLQIGYAQNVGIGSVEVTNSLSFVNKINIEVSGMTSEPSTVDDFVLIRIHPAALPEKGLTLDDFNIVGLPVFYGADLLFRDDADGGKALVVRTYEKITHTNASTANNGQPTNSFTYATNYAGKAYWSNGLCPANDPDAANHVYEVPTTAGVDYYLPQTSEVYEFPGKKLLSGRLLTSFSSNAGFRGHIVFLADTGTHGNAGVWVAGTDPEKKGNRNVQRFEGRITLPVESQMVSNLKYGDAMVVWASEIDGVGGMKFTTYPSASSASSNQGWHELTGANVNWKGKVLLTQDYSKPYSDGTVTPNWDYNVRLILNDGRNLGGRRDTFAADALKIEHYARVMIRDDVTLADGLNRGITVGDVGRFWQPAGKTLTVNQPIVLNGMLVKEGEGTLVLGGNDLTAAPDAKVVITNGALKVVHAHALDGAAVSFAEGTKLIIPISTDATTDFAKFGAMNTLGDGGFRSSATDGKILVELDYGDMPIAMLKKVAICTVTSDSTLTKTSFEVNPPQGCSAAVGEPTDNGDGTKTFSATLTFTGLTVTENISMDCSKLTLELDITDVGGADKLTVELKKKGDTEPTTKEVTSPAAGKHEVVFDGLSEGDYTYQIKLTGTYKGEEFTREEEPVAVSLATPSPVTPKDGKFVLSANGTVDLVDVDAVDYAVSSVEGKKCHLKWTDDKTGNGKYAVMNGQTLTVKEGQPENGMDSFMSYVLGLDPTDSTATTYIAAENDNDSEMLTLTMPKVKQRSESETGVAVSYTVQTSSDPSFSSDVTPGATTNENSFKASLPTAEGKVRYYRVQIDMK